MLLRLGKGCHPNIVHIYQPRLVGNQALVEMDYVDGVNLHEYIKQCNGHVPMEEVIRMTEQMSSALASCHHEIDKVCMNMDEDKGLIVPDPDDGKKVKVINEAELVEKYRVIHNDIHCGNIMRRNDGMYILLDFGLAVDGQGDVVGSSRMSKGAIEYKSPERWDGSMPTTQSDIYSFGCVLYAMITGVTPFPIPKTLPLSETDVYILMNNHKHDNPPEIDRKDVPSWLKEIVAKCLAKAPEERYRDGTELYEAVNVEILNMYRLRAKNTKEIESIKSARRHCVEGDKTFQTSLDEMEEYVLLESHIKKGEDKISSLKDSIVELGQEIGSLKSIIQSKDSEIKRLKESSPKPRWLPFVLLGLLLGGGLVYAISLFAEGGNQEKMAVLRAECDSLQMMNENISLQLKSVDSAMATYANRLRTVQKSKDSLENVVVSLRKQAKRSQTARKSARTVFPFPYDS